VTRPIVVEDQVWLAARSMVGPGITIGTGAVLSLGSVATHNLDPWQIHRGSPATAVKPRRCRDVEPADAWG
jgi:putative colanic acid biosynthesis acetyltransferase WcaF